MQPFVWLWRGMILLIVTLGIPARAQGPDPEAGARIYRSHCTECHGLKGEGGRGPNLNRGEFRSGNSDAALLRTIMTGIPGTEMPGTYLQEHQIRHVVAFLRRLNERAVAQHLKGDPVRGKAVYRKAGRGVCHLIRGEGGSMGPDLSDAGGSRAPLNLRTSITDPDADVPQRYWSVRYAGDGGRIETGLRLNEDTFSIQLLDAKQQLRTVSKQRTPAPVVERRSLMPSYRRLPEGDLDDLVAYLAAQRMPRRTQ